MLQISEFYCTSSCTRQRREKGEEEDKDNSDAFVAEQRGRKEGQVFDEGGGERESRERE